MLSYPFLCYPSICPTYLGEGRAAFPNGCPLFGLQLLTNSAGLSPQPEIPRSPRLRSRGAVFFSLAACRAVSPWQPKHKASGSSRLLARLLAGLSGARAADAEAAQRSAAIAAPGAGRRSPRIPSLACSRPSPSGSRHLDPEGIFGERGRMGAHVSAELWSYLRGGLEAS